MTYSTLFVDEPAEGLHQRPEVPLHSRVAREEADVGTDRLDVLQGAAKREDATPKRLDVVISENRTLQGK